MKVDDFKDRETKVMTLTEIITAARFNEIDAGDGYALHAGKRIIFGGRNVDAEILSQILHSQR